MTVTDSRTGALDEPAGDAVGSSSKGQLWTGRVLSALAVLFLLFDAFGKFTMPGPVVQACVRLGFPLSLSPTLGGLLTLSAILYAIPRTAVMGAVFLTGYLGGAVAIQLRAGSPLFETVFPAIFGIVVWAGIFLRDSTLRQVFPLRRLARKSGVA